ncbi:MAG: fused MFS/spermidine synthase [Acidobacteria bacterium]|nr:fused MFS/spermidine synthase [Acidobacteriota bacterium]
MTSTRQPMPARVLLPLLGALFFFSGASALVYQLLWLRMLGLVFGVTVHAASTVFASFMAGLAIGSYAAGRLASRVGRPLMWFGAAEGLIAVTALLTPWVLHGLESLYGSLHPSLPDSLAALTAVRFAIAFCTLIVPTALMGATLPLIMKSSLSRSAVTGARFGILYAANTSGAIAGTLAAGLWLIPAMGIRRTFLVAAAANLSVAMAAVIVGLRATPSAEGPDLAAELPARPPEIGGSARRVVLAVFALSGFTALALEVVWFRVNVLVLRPTVYAFAIMLATVLAGIALGSAAVAPWLKHKRNWLMTLALAELLIAAAGLLSFAALEAAPALITLAEGALAFLPAYLIPLIVTSVLTILPTMLLMGAAFPIGLHLWSAGAGSASAAARRVGTFYALNVCGSIAGSLAAGFVLLPLLGSRTTLIVIGAITAAAAMLLLAVDRSPLPRRLMVAAAGLTVLALIRVPDPFEVFLAQRFPGFPMLWHQEGVQTTVSVHQAGERRVMFLDGLHQASSVGSMVLTHRRIGHLGPALHRRASDVLVVGLGGGATAGAVSQYPFAHTDVVELSQAVAAGATFFSDINYDIFNRRNVTLRVDDGRSHLLLSGRKYDVITADIIQPIHAGAGNVYSAEYFSLVRSALRDGGLAVQWVFGTDAEYKMIMRTFLSVFPNSTLWADGSLMVGSVHPQELSRADFEWKLQVPPVREALATVGVTSFDDLQRLYTAGRPEMRRFVGRGPILTDDRPAVEYFLALPRAAVDLSSLRGDVRDIIRE